MLVSAVGVEALVGMRLLARHELRIAVVPGGVVEITSLLRSRPNQTCTRPGPHFGVSGFNVLPAAPAGVVWFGGVPPGFPRHSTSCLEEQIYFD
jgi:hypothetical protein